MLRKLSVLTLVTFLCYSCYAQTYTLSIKVEVGAAIKDKVKDKGRLFVFLNSNLQIEPKDQIWPFPDRMSYILAKNFNDFNKQLPLKLNDCSDWTKTVDWSLKNVPQGIYNVQVLWDHDFEESRINASGNLYSESVEVVVDKNTEVTVSLAKAIEPLKVIDHELVKIVDFKSDTLSAWWGKPMNLKATVLLPNHYKKGTAYPIRYNVAGYGGRYNRVNYLVGRKEFMNWWMSDDAPQVINVFLDGEGPYGDSYQMDSENSGPYGYALIHELIPHIESKYRGTDSSTTRFVDGCSTGGWVSLGLQLYYPDVFNGVFSYSPDAVEFENYQLINIYKDKNAYINEYGYVRPVMREVNGEPMISLKDFITYENVLGYSNTYITSGGQFSAHTALYSPKGDDGLPVPLFDPVTGEIDHTTAEHWKKYDFKLYAKENWKELGPKIKGKIYIWMGDMDSFYLNPATRAFDEFLKSTENPTSDAVVEFSPMKPHCANYSNTVVLKQIDKRLKEIKE